MLRQDRDRGAEMRLTERTRKLIPETRRGAHRKERSVIRSEDDVEQPMSNVQCRHVLWQYYALNFLYNYCSRPTVQSWTVICKYLHKISMV